MIVVSDATPLNYLVLIGAIEVLPRLFENVLVPQVVVRELQNPRTPQAVRDWIANPPPWLRVSEPAHVSESIAAVDAGEAHAIALAKERGIRDLLMDDYEGRVLAESQGLLTVTTVAILGRAAQIGLLDLGRALQALRHTTYRARPAVYEEALERYRTRRSPDPPNKVDS